MGFLSKLRKILGQIANVFIAGRQAGLWSKSDRPKIDPKG